jgi:hypothetical protein
MGAEHWGVDSVAQVDDQLAAAVNSFSGGSAVFWGRYFAYPGYALMTNPAAEAQAMRSHGIHWIHPTISPPPSHESAGFADGAADGRATCDGIAAIIGDSTGIYLPTQRHDNYGNAITRVYLDIEYDSYLTQDYWNGFAQAVSNYYFAGQYPFFPCAYYDPAGTYAAHNCYVLGGNTGDYVCYGIWSNRPEAGESTCNYCYSPGPAWGPLNCDSVVAGTRLWQYAENGVCPSFAYCGTPGYPDFGDGRNVDLDMSNPADDETYYMLYLP